MARSAGISVGGVFRRQMPDARTTGSAGTGIVTPIGQSAEWRNEVSIRAAGNLPRHGLRAVYRAKLRHGRLAVVSAVRAHSFI